MNKEAMIKKILNNLVIDEKHYELIVAVESEDVGFTNMHLTNTRNNKKFYIEVVEDYNCIQILNEEQTTVVKVLPITDGKPVKLKVLNGVKVIGANSCTMEDKKVSFKPIGLIEVYLPYSVERIERRAFYKNDLTELECPPFLNYIGDSAVYKNNLTNANLPYAMKELGDSAMSFNQIESITFINPIAKVEMGENAFVGNKIKYADLTGVQSVNFSALDKNEIERIFYPKTMKKFILEDEAISENGVELVIEQGSDYENLINNMLYCKSKKSCCDLDLKDVTLIIDEMDEELFYNAYKDAKLTDSSKFTNFNFVHNISDYKCPKEDEQVKEDEGRVM